MAARVLDTNVAISALIWRGAPYRRLQAIRRRARTVLLDSRSARLTERADALADCAGVVEIVAPNDVPHIVATGSGCSRIGSVSPFSLPRKPITSQAE